MTKADYLVTVYEATNRYDGSEGEFYLLGEDPHQWQNLWTDPAYTKLRDELVEELRAHWPNGRRVPLAKIAPV